MNKYSLFASTILISACLLTPAYGTNTVSSPVGFVRHVIPGDESVLASLPFEVQDPTIPGIFGDQLTGNKQLNKADRILKWDTASQENIILWKTDDDIWVQYPENTTETTNELGIGEGFWIENEQNSAQTVFLAGDVILSDSNTVVLYPALNYFGYPFSSTLPLNSSQLANDGAYGSSSSIGSDQITEESVGSSFWLLDDTNSANHGLWHDEYDLVTDEEFKLGHGYWYDRGLTNSFSWTEARPYADVFPVNGQPPVVTSITFNAGGDIATLGIETEGVSGEELEIYYKDLAASNAFNSTNGWAIADEDISTSNQTSVTWQDSGDVDRDAIDLVYCRIYLVARGDIDDDTDGIADARETFIYGTNPADSDTDDDGMPDGWEVDAGLNPLSDDSAGDLDTDGLSNLAEYQNGTDPNDSDSDNDGFSDGAEVSAETNPLDLDSYPITISGIISYSGSQTGTVVVLASLSSGSWTSSLYAEISSPGAYSITNVPNLTEYWVKSYCDNGNSAWDECDASGEWVSNSITPTNDVSNIDISLADESESPVVLPPADIWIECDESTAPSHTGTAEVSDNCSVIETNVSDVVRFNEVRANDDGEDNIEFIELVAVSGMNLEGFFVEHYNGADSVDGALFRFTFPSFVVPNDGVQDENGANLGFAVISQDSNGVANTDFILSDLVQNGPDGLVLYDAQSNILDAVAWEGAGDLATDDPGTVSTTPPASADNYLHVTADDDSGDNSLQAPNDVLGDTGTGWSLAVATPGAVNDDQASESIDIGAAELSGLIVEYADSVVTGACPNELTITRVWTATDALQNSASATQMIYVVDNAPELSGVPSNCTVSCDSVPAPATVTASDSCDGSVSVQYSQESSGGYTTIVTRTWTSTDSCSNTAEGIQVITVIPCDEDQDGLVDGWDGVVLTNYYLLGVDADADGYVDGESDYGTSPYDADSDDDGIPDGAEVLLGLDPLSASDGAEDADGDGWSNLEEWAAGTDLYDRLDAPRIARGVVINEVVYNPDGDDLGDNEWVELYCAGPNPVDLGGFYLDGTLSSASSNLTPFFTFPTNATILPGTHILVGGDAMSIRRDYTQNFALVNNSRGDKTGGVRLMADTNLVIDALLYDYPNIYDLPTNGFGYIGYPGDLPTYAISGESVVRARTGVDTDNVDDWLASANPSPEHAESVVDTDGDGVTDGDELSGQSNPSGQATDYLLADTDGDGLDDGEEYQLGTDPWLVDTDGDGIWDGMEVHETGSDPLVSDIGAITQTVWSVNGTDYTNSIGVWSTNGTSACSLSAGGGLYYEMPLATGGVYALEIEGTQYDQNADNSVFVLQLSIDGNIVGSKELRAEYGEENSIQWMLPYLDAGTHQVLIRWIFMSGNGSFRLIGVKAHEYGGEDNDENGQADWLDHRTNTVAGIENWQTNSLISPYCLEGTALNFDSLSVEGSFVPSNGIHAAAEAQRGLIGRWYANVPLAVGTGTVVTVDADNGWIEFQNTMEWGELNLFSPPTNSYLVRLNDGFLFNARPDGQGDGDIELSINGSPAYESESNMAWECYFTNAGIYEVSGTWTQGGSTEYAQTVTVEVVEASFGSDPGVWVGKEREWACAGISSNVWIEMDGDVLWSQTALPTGTLFNLWLGQPKAYTAVGRLGGGDGPIISTSRIRGFMEVFSSEYGEQAYAYDDGSIRVVMGLIIVAEEMPEDIEINIDIIAGGVVFSDYYVEDFLTTFLTLTPDDLNEWGVAPLAFYVSPDAWSTYCHVLTIEQDGIEIGEW